MSKRVTITGSPDSGLTLAETNIQVALSQAWEDFLRLDNLHPDDITEFRCAIHKAQNVLKGRVVTRIFPAFWR